MNVRRATVLDIDDCLDIARESYGNNPFDERKAVDWAVQQMLNPQIAFFRTDRAWGACAVVPVFYEPGPGRGVSLFMACRKDAAFQLCQVLRSMIAWAKARGATEFDFGEDTGMNLAPIAKRIGAKVSSPHYRVELCRHSEPSSPSFSPESARQPLPMLSDRL